MAKKKAGGKKKKKSKEELEAERLVLEEQERERLEIEAERRREEEALRLEREAFERAERERLRREELDRLTEEADQTRTLADRRKRARQTYLRSRKKSEGWSRFVQCSPLPVPESEAELNTYLQQVLEDSKVDAEYTLLQCQELDYVTQGLIVTGVKLLCEGKRDQADKCMGKVAKVLATQMRRIDAASSWILDHAQEFVSPKMEVLLGFQNSCMKLGLWMNLAAKGFRMKIIDFPSVAMIAEIPKTLALQNIAVRTLYFKSDTVTSKPADYESGDDYDTALGGIVFLEALKLPPPSKNLKGWDMKPVNRALQGKVQRLNFNANENNPAGNTDSTAVTPAVSVTLKFKVPRDVLVRNLKGEHCPIIQTEKDNLQEDEEEEEAKVAVESLAVQQDAFKEIISVRVGAWDPIQRRWVEDAVSDVAFDPQSRILCCATTRLSCVALIQKKYVDLPFRFWLLQPVYVSRSTSTGGEDLDTYDLDEPSTDNQTAVQGAVLYVKCDNWLIRLMIHDDGTCTLQEPHEPELDKILNQPMPIATLLVQLAACGINLVAPSDSACDLLGGKVKAKALDLENTVYEEISSAVSSSFTITSSRWNKSLGESKCCFNLHRADSTSGEAADISAFINYNQNQNSSSTANTLPLSARGDQPTATDSSSGAKGDTDETKDPEESSNQDTGDGEGKEGGEQGEDQQTQENGEQEDSTKPAEAKEGEAEQGESGNNEQASAQPTARSDVSTPKKKKKGSAKKGKGSKKQEAKEEEVVEQVIPEEQGEDLQVAEEPDPVPTEPRTVMFELDEGAKDTGLKCSFLRVKDTDETFDSTIAKDQVTHCYLENCLLAAGIYDEASIHLMQDAPDLVPLRHSILSVLLALRPLSLTHTLS